MRKHDVRKWLHAVLDLLPVILIPVFMIYSHRHEINTGSIEVPQKLAIDFNQKCNPTIFRNTDDWNGLSIQTDNNGTHIVGSPTATSRVQFWLFDTNQSLVTNHHYYFTCKVNSNAMYRISMGIDGVTSYPSLPQYNVLATTYRYYIQLEGNSSEPIDTYVYFQTFDLTQMFGDDIPSRTDFDNLFDDNYYQYVESKKLLIDNGSITYNDTDIMSQFTYQLYNSVDKYFNMGNVFNMNGVYDWFNLNIFHGSAPIYIYVVWQIVLYEFVMDLLFLLYGLFMWFIDMIEKLMEKPINSVR